MLRSPFDLAGFTTETFAALLDSGSSIVALLAVGSVEPHGPHLSLLTDTVISIAVAQRAAELLANISSRRIAPIVAPSVNYGVTDCAAGFAGALSISADALTTYLKAVATSLLQAGCRVVCLVNNHLEPEHDRAVRAATGPGVVVACPLTRKWARTLSAEFKSGQCHAGEYETSIMLAADASLVNESKRAVLPTVAVSLSQGLALGQTTFAAMGMNHAYAGSPAAATAEQGRDMIERLAEMVVAEVVDELSAIDVR
jgi:creatinine amidohydrolase